MLELGYRIVEPSYISWMGGGEIRKGGGDAKKWLNFLLDRLNILVYFHIEYRYLANIFIFGFYNTILIELHVRTVHPQYSIKLNAMVWLTTKPVLAKLHMCLVTHSLNRSLLRTTNSDDMKDN